MPKSKNRKNHKKKVAARNQRIQAEKNKMKKFQDAFYQQMMEDIKNGSLDEENVKSLDSVDGEETADAVVVEEASDDNTDTTDENAVEESE